MTEEVCCTQVIEQGEKIHALDDRQTRTEEAVRKIFDRIDTNQKWTIGLIMTAVALVVEGIGLFVAIIHYAKP
jgi:hypothetical protein